MTKRGTTIHTSLSALLLIARAGGALAQMPAAVAAPEETPVVTFHAEGAQIYECKPGEDGKLAWAFREPIAALIDSDKTVGRHYAGPSWEDVDGSIITAKASGNAPGATSSDIPWLKLDVATHKGHGLFAKVTNVQRLNTQGGALTGSCDKAGDFKSVAYTATYVFLHK
jgi:Protein of unknown function (DUF3455)